MWPFRKTPIKTSPAESPAQTTIPTIQFETICPLCFERYESGTIIADYPFCPDCSSEAIEFDVREFDEFMRETSIDELVQVLSRWNDAEGFLPAYKQLKSTRIAELIELKRTEK